MPLASVIFDLDGTLLDTIADIAHALNRALAASGFPEVSREVCRENVGWGASELVRRVLPGVARDNPTTVATVTGHLSRFYQEDPVSRTRPYPGTLEMLQELRRSPGGGTTPLAVLSNKPDELVQLIVSALFPGDLFACVQGASSRWPVKPDPASARHVMDVLGSPAGATAFVGDSVVDIQTARGAGCVAVAAAWGYRPAKELRSAGPDHVCYTVDDAGHLLTSLLTTPITQTRTEGEQLS